MPGVVEKKTEGRALADWIHTYIENDSFWRARD